MRRRFSLTGQLLSVAVLAAVMIPARAGVALADGDPASDVLLVQSVFFPYQPKVSRPLERQLEGALSALGRASRVHFKVAIISSAPELGLVPKYFAHPQSYAKFLDREISFNSPRPLLTVMPNGFGVMPRRYAPALAGLHVAAHEGSNGLTRSASLAVIALSRYLGHPVTLQAAQTNESSGSFPSGLAFGLPVGLLLLAGIWLAYRSRTSSRQSDRET